MVGNIKVCEFEKIFAFKKIIWAYITETRTSEKSRDRYLSNEGLHNSYGSKLKKWEMIVHEGASITLMVWLIRSEHYILPIFRPGDITSWKWRNALLQPKFSENRDVLVLITTQKVWRSMEDWNLPISVNLYINILNCVWAISHRLWAK